MRNFLNFYALTCMSRKSDEMICKKGFSDSTVEFEFQSDDVKWTNHYSNRRKNENNQPELDVGNNYSCQAHLK